MKKAVIHTDGASLGNPGPAGIGICIEITGKIQDFSEHIGIATNNVAEYTALVRGLEEASRLGVRSVEVFLDSELVVKQLLGEYKVKNPTLKPFNESAVILMKSFAKCSVKHVPREENKRADALAKKGAETKKAAEKADLSSQGKDVASQIDLPFK